MELVESKSKMWTSLGFSFLYMALVGGAVAYVIIRSSSRDIGSILGLSQGFKEAEFSDVTFDDVVGVDRAKEEMKDLVDYLQNPDKFTERGATLPKGTCRYFLKLLLTQSRCAIYWTTVRYKCCFW